MRESGWRTGRTLKNQYILHPSPLGLFTDSKLCGLRMWECIEENQTRQASSALLWPHNLFRPGRPWNEWIVKEETNMDPKMGLVNSCAMQILTFAIVLQFFSPLPGFGVKAWVSQNISLHASPSDRTSSHLVYYYVKSPEVALCGWRGNKPSINNNNNNNKPNFCLSGSFNFIFYSRNLWIVNQNVQL